MSSSDDRPDQRVVAGRYQLGAVIGRGGMGRVHAGHDLRLGRPVAVKLLRAELAAEPATRRRFEREAQIAAGVTHPHIVTIYDTGEDDVPFIVMERLPGPSLADEIATGPLEVDRLHRVATEVLSALALAHARGVLHRDVKPGNVLITADDHVKVADFGIAKTTDDPSETTGVFGTAAYLAPERLGGAPATPRSDLYSLGVVLYEAATGHKPFEADTPLGTLHAVAHEQPPSLSTLRPELDTAFIRVVEQAMRKDPEQRFASADDMAAALERSAATAPIADDSTVRVVQHDPTALLPDVLRPPPASAGAPPPVSAGAPAGRGGRSPRARVAIVIAVVLAVAAIALAGWAASRDSATTPPTTQHRVVITTSRPSPTTTVAPVSQPRVPPGNGNGNGKGNGKDK